MKETPVKANSRSAMRYRGVACLNCGHPLDVSDRYCSYCGQLNTTKRLTLKDFLGEFLLSIVNYDSRFWNTLKDLLFKPGIITRNYVEGKRHYYANPFRFFLSASIFYFIVISIFSFFESDTLPSNDVILYDSGDSVQGEQLTPILEDSTASKIDGLPKSINTVLKQSLEQARKEAEDSNREEIRKDSLKKATGRSYRYIAEEDLEKLKSAERFFEKLTLFQNFYRETGIIESATALDSLNYAASNTNVWLYNKIEVIDRIEKNPLKFVQYLLSKIPFFLFFFAPIYALFFWLIYAKRKVNYMEHLVLIFHIFTWVFVVLLLCLLPDKLLFGSQVIASIILLLIGPFYFYKALRNFYEQKRTITLIKFVFLNIVFLIGTNLFALIFFTLTAAFY